MGAQYERLAERLLNAGASKKLIVDTNSLAQRARDEGFDTLEEAHGQPDTVLDTALGTEEDLIPDNVVQLFPGRSA